MSRQKKIPASVAAGAGQGSKTDSTNRFHDTTEAADMQELYAASLKNEERERQLRRQAAWQRAVAKLSIEFEAAQGGGCPEELKGLLPDERLKLLKALGFRVVRRFTTVPDGDCWVVLSGRLCVCLADGFVGRA